MTQLSLIPLQITNLSHYCIIIQLKLLHICTQLLVILPHSTYILLQSHPLIQQLLIISYIISSLPNNEFNSFFNFYISIALWSNWFINVFSSLYKSFISKFLSLKSALNASISFFNWHVVLNAKSCLSLKSASACA